MKEIINKGLLDRKVDLVFKNTCDSSKSSQILYHFNEILKLQDNSDENISLAKEYLVRMSNDSEQREIYEMRANTLRDKISALNNARKEEKIKIAKNLLDILSDEIIADKTGLDIEEIKKLREEN